MDAKKMMDQITDTVQKNANAKAVFGDTVVMKGVSIIPVAKVRVYGGGGGGEAESLDPQDNGEMDKGHGMGIGLSIQTTPLGYIQINEGEAHFKRILDVNKLALAGIALLGLILWQSGRR